MSRHDSEIALTPLEALSAWKRVVVRALRTLSFDYSARQVAIVLAVYLDQGPHTIRALAAMLGISKAAVCRAVDTLSENDLVRRRKDEMDRRNVFIERTPQGSVLLSDLADVIVQEMTVVDTGMANGDAKAGDFLRA